MPIWLIFAALATIAVTGLLVWLLYRINLPGAGRDQSGDEAGD